MQRFSQKSAVLTCQQRLDVRQDVAAKLARLGIHTVQDILFHLPLRYQDRTRLYPIGQIKPHDHVALEGIIETVAWPTVGRTRLMLQLRDSTGAVSIRFFYTYARQRHTLLPGARLRCFGEVRQGKKGLEMVHPDYYLADADVPIDERLTPIYPTTEGLAQTQWRKLTQQALQQLLDGGVLQEVLPLSVRQALKFPSLQESLYYVHRPPPDAPLHDLLAKRHPSQRRLIFEELLAHRLSLLNLKKAFQQQHAPALLPHQQLTQAFLQALPFALTAAQLKVSQEIAADLAEPHPMLRLIQGDVGCGKTVVAALAILQAIENGYQAALLVPTELLSEQHVMSFQRWFSPLGLTVVHLAGKKKQSERRQLLAAIQQGEAHVIIGTHALFQKGVKFARLALIVVDEQHRFGVEQRAALREKGMQSSSYPHQLIMTATPIPRTLAMSVYADLDYSIIDELPPGRTPVLTTVISNERRADILARIREVCTTGRQVYWVCTLITESEQLQCQAAEETLHQLTLALPEVSIGLLHGKMKPCDKEQTMLAFRQQTLQLLVATTVIEVGVDIPNASLMIIENAERLGLAQLHQLRGRVGRGQAASYCVLLYQSPLSRLAKERLAVMRETTDGFKIAQRDLALRGPGEVLGTRQTGEIALRMADLIEDNDLLPAVQQVAATLQQHHPEYSVILIERWLGSRQHYGQV